MAVAFHSHLDADIATVLQTHCFGSAGPKMQAKKIGFLQRIGRINLQTSVASVRMKVRDRLHG